MFNFWNTELAAQIEVFCQLEQTFALHKNGVCMFDFPLYEHHCPNVSLDGQCSTVSTK